MEKIVPHVDKKVLLENKSNSICRSLARLFFDIESIKRMCVSKDEIDELRHTFYDLLQEYREVQKQLISEP